MPVQTGATNKLNLIKGFAKVIASTATEETALADHVFQANILIKKSNGKLYLTDGTTAFSALAPIVDSVLTVFEKQTLDASLSTGAYVPTAGGVAVLGTGGKLADSDLNLIDSADGKLKDSYLKMLDANGKISPSYIPDAVRVRPKIVATYADLANVTDEEKKGFVYVANASGDPTVESGWAQYLWIPSLNDGAGGWQKTDEGESLDVDVTSFFTYENVAATGAVMYDQPEVLEISLTEVAQLTPAESSGESGSEG